nr:MAG TPA: hypothetical protein [Bacteriophage sp.]
MVDGEIFFITAENAINNMVFIHISVELIQNKFYHFHYFRYFIEFSFSHDMNPFFAMRLNYKLYHHITLIIYSYKCPL